VLNSKIFIPTDTELRKTLQWERFNYI